MLHLSNILRRKFEAVEPLQLFVFTHYPTQNRFALLLEMLGKQKAFRRNHVHRKAYKALNVFAYQRSASLQSGDDAHRNRGFALRFYDKPQGCKNQITISATWAICAPAS
ncbi:hypothetical protein HED55_00100 [Ochrobactrum haematophilum]|uniref:Uncharacterized protein n=1 Tax=Brucella haematophila TaxID=419474 RepID=A0ABX1DHE8_9HYPH|nr:hypothetical protein [Brucella haematophila]